MATTNQPHVLAINQSEDVLRLFQDLLEAEHYRVSTQSSIERDIGAIIRQAPDVIILDYMWDHEDTGSSLLPASF